MNTTSCSHAQVLVILLGDVDAQEEEEWEGEVEDGLLPASEWPMASVEARMAARTQLSEEEYLAAHVSAAAQGGPRHLRKDFRRVARLDDVGEGCAGCRLLTRQRAAAREQVETLDRAHTLLEEEVEALRAEVAVLRARVEGRAYDEAAGGHAGEEVQGAEEPTAVLNTEEPLPRSKTEEPMAALMIAHPVPSADMLLEGDGRYPDTVVASCSPHGLANVISIAQLPTPEGGQETVLATGGADRRLTLTSFGIGPDARAPIELTSILLPGPPLALAYRPSPSMEGEQGRPQWRASGLLVTSCLDGSVHVLRVLLTGLKGCSPAGACSASLSTACAPLGGHVKYVTRLAWSPDGALLATASADRSLALWSVDDRSTALAAEEDADEWRAAESGEEGAAPPPTAVFTKLQQLHFERGGVDALSWLEEGPGVCTLAFAVRGGAALYYLRSLTGARAHATARALVAGADGQALPTLVPSLSALVLHRVPLSEDGTTVDIAWASLREKGLDGAVEAAEGGRPLPSLLRAAPPAPRSDLVAFGSLEARAQASVQRPAHVAPSEGVLSLAGIESGSDPSLGTDVAAAAASRAEQTASASTFIPVGFAITDLAVCPPTHGPALLASSADNGIVYLHPWGSNAVLRRLVGHGAPGQLDAPTRLAWLPLAAGGAPYYLTATCAADHALLVYSAGGGRPVARLSVGAGVAAAHTGTVRDLAVVTGGGATLASVGFDKRVLLWK